MIILLEKFNKSQLKTDPSEVRAGDTVRVYQKIKEEEEKYRIQVFEGLVIAKKHGKGVSATITVRKIISGVGVEKIFPIHSPLITKIEIVKKGKTKRAKLYYLRTAKGKKARIKTKEFAAVIAEPDQSPFASEPEKEPSQKTKEEPLAKAPVEK